MSELSEGLVAGLLVALIVAAFARWRGWSVAIPVLVAGIVVGFLPLGPTAPDDAGELFLLILAPLVFGEALSTSYIDFRKFRQPIFALAVGLVLLSSVAVGAVAAAIVPGLPLALAFALGAILAPTDAVAVAALARRVAMPRRVVTILEGESLVNDGTGLTLLRVALAAAAAGTVSGGEIALILAQSVIGGLLVGVVGGFALAWLVRRGPDQTVVNAFVLIAPFPVYFLAEALNGSGILAVVTTALIVANTMLTHRRFEGRRSSVAAWRQITFILTASAFFLVGLELPETVLALPGRSCAFSRCSSWPWWPCWSDRASSSSSDTPRCRGGGTGESGGGRPWCSHGPAHAVPCPGWQRFRCRSVSAWRRLSTRAG